jgi:hypothetical protein
LQAQLTSRDYAEWRAYFKLEPFGDVRADARIGILSSLIANAYRDPKRKRSPYKPEDFVPRFEQGEQTQQSQLTLVEMMNKAFGGKDLRQPFGDDSNA